MKAKILSFGLWMQKEGYRYARVRGAVKTLKSIARQVDPLEPDSVKEFLAKAQFSESRKERIVDELARFYRWKGIEFKLLKYRRVLRLPFIPLESEVEQLISGMGPKTATFLQLLRETGMRPGEAWALLGQI